MLLTPHSVDLKSMPSSVPTYPGYPAPTPGLGLGWTKVADALGQYVTPEEIELSVADIEEEGERG